MLNLTRAGKFGSLSNYCFVPAMPMEPPAKKRRYLKGMGLAEADREQSPRGPPKSFGWWALSARRVRHFMPVACELAKSHAGSAYGNHRYEMLVALNEVYGLVDSPLHMFKCPEPDQVKFEKAINKCLAHYGWLAKEAFKQNRLAWSTPPHNVPAVTMKKCRFFWRLFLKQLVVRDDV